jgi:hypothetical protein
MQAGYGVSRPLGSQKIQRLSHVVDCRDRLLDPLPDAGQWHRYVPETGNWHGGSRTRWIAALSATHDTFFFPLLRQAQLGRRRIHRYQ